MDIELGRDKSTISRELKRNTGARGYRPKQAHEMAVTRFKNAEKAIKLTVPVVGYIAEKITLEWNPEQVAGRLFKDENVSLSHETIYQYILKDKEAGGFLYEHLRCQKPRRKRYGTKVHDRRGQIVGRVIIEKRPAIVDKKIRRGDWEADLVIGKGHKGALVTLADRKSKKLKTARVENKEADPVANKVSELLEDEIARTITFDNGKEFSHHEKMANKTGAKTYFAHPYSSWERGLNENTNGLIRQYLPKGRSFENVTDSEVQWIEDSLNNRPKKSLGYCTPNEINSGEKRVKLE